RKVPARLRGRGRRIPAQCARGARRRRLALCKKLHSVCVEQRCAAVQHALGESGDRIRVRKTAGMPGYAAHNPGIFIVDLALHYAVPEGAVVFRGWNMSLVWMSGEIEADEGGIERLKDFAAAECVQSLTGKPLQGYTEEDKADVAVLG